MGDCIFLGSIRGVWCTGVRCGGEVWIIVSWYGNRIVVLLQHNECNTRFDNEYNTMSLYISYVLLS
jgi:hypothetical protein